MRKSGEKIVPEMGILWELGGCGAVPPCARERCGLGDTESNTRKVLTLGNDCQLEVPKEGRHVSLPVPESSQAEVHQKDLEKSLF